MATAKIAEAFDVTLGAPDFLELEEAVALVCCKYDGTIGFNVELPLDARTEVIRRLRARKVRVKFCTDSQHADLHRHLRMVCWGER